MKRLLMPYNSQSLNLKNHLVMGPMTRSRGSEAPFTAQQSASTFNDGILTNTESGKYWDITIPGTDDF